MLMKRAGVGPGSFPEVLCIPEPDRVSPHWVHLQLHGHELQHEDTGEIEYVAAGWPTDASGALTLNVAATQEFVVWAVEANVTPCPTPDQLLKESARLNELLTSGFRPMPIAARRREAARVAAPRLGHP